MGKRSKQRQRSTATGPTGTSSAAPTAENEPWRTLGFDWREHTGALVGVMSVLIVAIRIWSISDGQPETAYGLVQESGAVNAGLGSMIGFLPVGMMLGYSIAYTVVLDRQLETPGAPSWPVVMLVAVAALAASVLSTAISLFVIVSATINVMMLRSGGSIARKGLVWIYVLACLVPFAAIINDPWQPSERVDPAHGEPFTGYVLSDQDGELVLLRHEPREIIRLDSSQVDERGICEGIQQDGPDWLWWRFGPGLEEADYPACPDR